MGAAQQLLATRDRGNEESRAIPGTEWNNAFDLIERDGEDMSNRRFLNRKAALARLLRHTEAGILFNEHITEDGLSSFAYACRLGEPNHNFPPPVLKGSSPVVNAKQAPGGNAGPSDV